MIRIKSHGEILKEILQEKGMYATDLAKKNKCSCQFNLRNFKSRRHRN